MYSVDKSGVKKIMLDFYKQIEESEVILKSAKVKIDKKVVTNILYIGVGGSAIAGDLLNDVLFDQIKVPIHVVRSYQLPRSCNKETLVFAASYSGNTEETLSALEQATKSGAQIVVITSGGKMAELAEKKGWQLIIIPEGLTPRHALGYFFFPLYRLLGSKSFFRGYDKDLSSLVKFVKSIARRNEYPRARGHVLSKELAQTIHNKIPIFYSTAPYLKTVSRRWQNQVQENGKSMAFSNILPEMNHNEIVGWEQDTRAIKNFIVIFLENEKPHPRIKKRIDLSKELIKKRGVEVVDIYSTGNSVMEKVFSLVVLGDWVSYYLAIGYKKDPSKIKNIDYLKTQMSAD